MKPDYRPILWLKNVDGCRLFDFNATNAIGVDKYMLKEKENVKNFKIEK